MKLDTISRRVAILAAELGRQVSLAARRATIRLLQGYEMDEPVNRSCPDDKVQQETKSFKALLTRADHAEVSVE